MESRTYRGDVNCPQLGQTLALRLDSTLVKVTANCTNKFSSVNVDYFEDAAHQHLLGALTIKIARKDHDLEIVIIDRSPAEFPLENNFQSNDDIEDMVLLHNLFSNEQDLRDEFMIDFQFARLWKLIDDFLTARDCVQVHMDIV